MHQSLLKLALLLILVWDKYDLNLQIIETLFLKQELMCLMPVFE